MRKRAFRVAPLTMRMPSVTHCSSDQTIWLIFHSSFHFVGGGRGEGCKIKWVGSLLPEWGQAVLNRLVHFGLISTLRPPKKWQTEQNCQVWTNLHSTWSVLHPQPLARPTTLTPTPPDYCSRPRPCNTVDRLRRLNQICESYTVSRISDFDSSVTKSKLLHGSSFHVQVRKVKSSTVTLHMRSTQRWRDTRQVC